MRVISLLQLLGLVACTTVEPEGPPQAVAVAVPAVAHVAAPRPRARPAARWQAKRTLSVPSCGAPAQICEAARHVARRVRYAPDRDVWGVEQHWGTPAEVYARGAGDCEDLALLVRLELVSRGIEPNRIAVRYGYLDGSEFHVWLTVRDERGRRWIVSNARVAAAGDASRRLVDVGPSRAG